MIREISIPSDNVKSFEHRIAKLNKRGKKLGCEPITLTITGTELKEFNPARGSKYFVEFTNITIKGDDPVLEGYRLIASIDQDPELGVMINVVPGAVLPEKYRESNGSCDHCKAKRNRKKTIVVFSETEGYKEIGRMCVKDFLKTNAIDRYSWLEGFVRAIDEFVAKEEEEFRSGELRYSPMHDLAHVLACAIKAIADHGYISKTYAMENSTEFNVIESTCSRMWLMLYGDRFSKVAPYKPSEEEFEEADKIITWAKEITDSSDYNYTIRKMAEVGITRDKYMGFAVSMVPAYRRAMGLIADKEKKAALPPSEYVGEVGKRVEFNLTFLGEYSFHSFYGLTTIYRFREGANNNVVWMSTARENYEVGKEYHVKATVKSHEVYKDHKQTKLSRVKVKEA